MYKIGICDDGQNMCSSIEEMVVQYAVENRMELEVEVWYTGEGLCSYFVGGSSLDILFLDIELLDMTGIEVGSFIRNQMENRDMQIIYISGKSSYVFELFKTQPLDFLLKPIAQDQITNVLALAMKLISNDTVMFEFRNGKEFFRIPFQEIMYIFSEGKKVKLATPKGMYAFYGKLKDRIKSLPIEFVAIHQSYVVNKTYVERYTYEMVEMIDGSVFTISKANRKKVRQDILREEERGCV